LQSQCSHEQSMSGVFSIASHWTLEYLPEVVTHEQIGCAHFLAFAVAISFLLMLINSHPKQHLRTLGKGSSGQ